MKQKRERPPLTAAQAELAALWWPYAFRQAMRMSRGRPEGRAQDALDAASDALVAAAAGFDPSLGYQFSTYLHWALVRNISRALAGGRAADRPLPAVQLSAVTAEGGLPYEPADPRGKCPLEAALEAERNSALAAAAAALGPRVRELALAAAERGAQAAGRACSPPLSRWMVRKRLRAAAEAAGRPPLL